MLCEMVVHVAHWCLSFARQFHGQWAFKKWGQIGNSKYFKLLKINVHPFHQPRFCDLWHEALQEICICCASQTWAEVYLKSLGSSSEYCCEYCRSPMQAVANYNPYSWLLSLAAPAGVCSLRCLFLVFTSLGSDSHSADYSRSWASWAAQSGQQICYSSNSDYFQSLTHFKTQRGRWKTCSLGTTNSECNEGILLECIVWATQLVTTFFEMTPLGFRVLRLCLLAEPFQYILHKLSINIFTNLSTMSPWSSTISSISS